MLDFHERRRLKRTLYSKGVALLLLLLIFVLARGVWGVYSKEREAVRTAAQRAAELQELRAREVALAAELERVSTPRGVEGELREKYDLAKPGESMIVLIEPPAEKEKKTEVRGFWPWLKNFFGF